MNLKLKNKVAFVSGGSHGVGYETVKVLLEEGCKVFFVGRDPARIDTAMTDLQRISKSVSGQVCDIQDYHATERCLNEIIKNEGAIDIVVHNVGGGGRWGNEDPMLTGLDVWREVIEKNVLQTINITKLTLPKMLDRNYGRFVYIGSIYGKEIGGRPWFNIAKTAQAVLAKNFSMNFDYARANITFNVVAPGSLMIAETGWDDFARSNPIEYQRILKEDYPLGRLGEPREVAVVVAFIASPIASLLNGANIQVDGGASRCL